MAVHSLPQKPRQETPGERADRLGQEGYTVKRTAELGVYLITRPDRTRTYRVDVANYTCNCQATTQWCKHQIYCRWFFLYDRAVFLLAEARNRGVLVWECEIELWTATDNLRRVTTADRRARVAA